MNIIIEPEKEEIGVKELTINHDVLDDNAVVYPRDLGAALSRVDNEWYKPKEK